MKKLKFPEDFFAYDNPDCHNKDIEKEGLPPNDCDAVLVSMQPFIGNEPEVFEAVWNGRFWADTYENCYNVEKSEFGEKYAQVTHWAYMPKPPKEV